MDTKSQNQIEEIYELGAVTTETKGSLGGVIPDDHAQYRTPMGIAED